MPSSFRTYEAQSRLLVAVLASIPDIRLNFKGKLTGFPFIFAFRYIAPSLSFLLPQSD